MAFLVPIVATIASSLIATSTTLIGILGPVGAALLGAGAAIAITAVPADLEPRPKESIT